LALNKDSVKGHGHLFARDFISARKNFPGQTEVLASPF